MEKLAMRRLGLLAAASLAAFAMSLYGQGKQFHLGHRPDPTELQQWNITVLPDGTGLPPGSGTPIEGEKVYENKCATCHGQNGQGNEPLGARLVGGIGTLKAVHPVLTPGSYWPYATTLWDYIHRAMPYPQPGTLSANETYAVTAFLLFKNGIIKTGAVMNKETLPKVQMPNRSGFVADPRPDIKCSQTPK
jgi:S-disulfanyl-L-cysteine oxidoreductase SoxD